MMTRGNGSTMNDDAKETSDERFTKEDMDRAYAEGRKAGMRDAREMVDDSFRELYEKLSREIR